jgi:hypothetical protein
MQKSGNGRLARRVKEALEAYVTPEALGNACEHLIRLGRTDEAISA